DGAERKDVLHVHWFPLEVEVRVEDANLGDVLDGKVVSLRGLPDRLGIGSVVDAEHLLSVFAHVRVDPGHSLSRIPLDDFEALFRALGVDRSPEPVREEALDDIPWQLTPPSVG